MSVPKLREIGLLVFLALLPAFAHAPAWTEQRLLGPGEGTALHYPLRAAVWEAYRRGELPSWNGAIFSGTALLSSYPSGAFFPLMPLFALLGPFPAFQLLVLVSLGATAVLTFSYVRRLGAGSLGAYVSALGFALGPYLLAHLGDTATVVAAPALLLALIAAESHLDRPTPARAAGLAATTALLLLAGSKEAAQAGAALLAGRLLLARRSGRTRPGATLRAIVLGLLLAAPQLVPTVFTLPDSASAASGLLPPAAASASGVTGLLLRSISHTPAPALTLAALPLLAGRLPARAFGLALAVSVVLQWGRGPLLGAGPSGLVLDLGLAVLAGLALDAQWAERREALGRRLRGAFLLTSLASAAALSVAAAVVGPLPQMLAGAVGVLALAMILYFIRAGFPDPSKAGVFLLPLTVSFLLQPHGRQAWAGAPLRTELERGTPTREAVDRALGPRRAERLLTLVRQRPAREDELDLAYGGLSVFAARRTANGGDPFVPRLRLLAYDGMTTAGTLPDGFFRSDPARLRVLGVRWVQAPTAALKAAPDASGMGETLDLAVEPGRPRFFPLPIATATELRLVVSLDGAAAVPPDEPVAEVVLRLVSGHELPLPLRAGSSTQDRAVLKLPGRYTVDGLRVERRPGAGRLVLRRLGLIDAVTGRRTAVSLASGYLSDTLFFREAATTPSVRLFEVRGTFGAARVVDNLRPLPDETAVLAALRSPTLAGLDPRREVLMTAAEASAVDLPEGSRAGRAAVARAEGNRLDLRAIGPGLLVVNEGWDGGWRAQVDGRPAPLLRVNGTVMGVVLEAGPHFVALRHRALGFGLGLGLAGLGLTGLLVLLRRRI